MLENKPRTLLLSPKNKESIAATTRLRKRRTINCTGYIPWNKATQNLKNTLPWPHLMYLQNTTPPTESPYFDYSDLHVSPEWENVAPINNVGMARMTKLRSP